MNVTPFKFTADDLGALDKKTRTGLQPLLEALNVTMQELVAALASLGNGVTNSGTFTSGAAGTAYVDITPSPRLAGRPSFVTLGWFARSDETAMTTPYSFSTSIAGDGGTVRLLFAGLDASAKYVFTVRVE